MTKAMSGKDYWYWNGRLSQYDDFGDGAWWQACQDLIGGYDKLMAYLEASKIYDKEKRDD
jgi:hypothetical protein